MSLTLHTSLGDIKVELACAQAPKLCEVSRGVCLVAQPHPSALRGCGVTRRKTVSVGTTLAECRKMPTSSSTMYSASFASQSASAAHRDLLCPDPPVRLPTLGTQAQADRVAASSLAFRHPARHADA